MFVYCALKTVNVRVEFFVVLCLKQLVVELISQWSDVYSCCFSACVFRYEHSAEIMV